MKWMDSFIEKYARSSVNRGSRRSFLRRMGTVVVGASALPLLPVDRVAAATGGDGDGKTGDPGDPTSCDYWRYCGVDGFLCACCGGSASTCPPGSEPSPITWVGTCRNPSDGRSYIISYNDCCGQGSCNRCACTRNERETPTYDIRRDNDTNWCLAAKSMSYHCSTAVVVGLADE
ncbi:Aralkylamine dehydrogenase light chain [wastewater metagenome]|uniref:Aralkylamine dehydrogenase light chain n=2 Tax=unclassified sequences TaxID=12908 RepID=A0A5B8R5M6_9ZZZZ|nr:MULTISPECIES: methylamine dehydrogenase light chain [Arhodomonas]MCS4502736.1 methylamine dehydrogenase (amicyanin) light chain [Arhodomonas aquaeolei]QEA03781.1 aralkylamine dehydrogenase light chain [uncultured organism]